MRTVQWRQNKSHLEATYFSYYFGISDIDHKGWQILKDSYCKEDMYRKGNIRLYIT